ncbi:hypothetical protein DPMN_164825 [Dreissena polymorpha]|uniref:NACHT domain-containing protein n=1 Tax=Dreissena polymorpha TaxID=45954 RepID=A0A9D4EYH8_DREPO|nr:hypothetical protein DPMN_164825 [Dreissena polymorpha]
MARLADVFTEPERTNWLKAWLAIDISKSGLEQFVENEAQTLHGNIYNAVWASVQAQVSCTGCHIANLLKCPSQGICNKRGAYGLRTSMHHTALKQPQPCPANVCNKVIDEIEKQHRFFNPSWKNIKANYWASNPWEIAKAYLPPDGYTENISVRDTDFNGIISFIINCKHFDNKFSFPIAPGKTHPSCILSKARELGRTVRHSSSCKVTDKDLQDIFITLICLLTDTQCLAHDLSAREAVRKLAKLQTDVLKLTTEEIVDLLESAQDKLKTVEHITEAAIGEMRTYIEHCKRDLSAHTDKCKQKLSKYTGKCKMELDKHCWNTTESYYEKSCKEFRRRLIAHYNDASRNVPFSNFVCSIDKRILDIYATPNIHRIEIKKDGKLVKKEEALTYKQIFYTDDDSNLRIYLQGEPGTGKTTFSAKLVRDWCHGYQVSSTTPCVTTAFNDVSTIQKFKFLFFITSRDSKGQTDVTQMIKKQLIDKTFSEDERAFVYKLFVKIINSEICLVLRDGLDERVSPDSINLAESPIAGYQNDTCTILTISRPSKLADEDFKKSHIDILLEIQGIRDPYEFSENILRRLIDQAKNLEETSKKIQSLVRYSKLESLSTSPKVYTLVICNWVNTIEKEDNWKGPSRCALYTTLVESLCKKANSALGYFNDSHPPPVDCFSCTSYIQPNIEQLDKLAEVACKLLLASDRKSSYVSNEIPLSSYFPLDEFTVCKEFALKAGILLTNIKDNTRTDSSISFVDKTVQNFFAAYHIACNPYVFGVEVSSYLERNNTSYRDISHVLIFLCGMNISAANKLSALMNPCDISHCSCKNGSDTPCEFQRIIESGIREATANNQDAIQMKLSHFYIDKGNIRDLNNIWCSNTIDAQRLFVKISRSDFLSSSEGCKSTSHYEFNLSSCHNLKKLVLSGWGIWLRDTAGSTTSEVPVWIVLNSTDPAQCADPPLILSSIENIHLASVKCSSFGLRSLLRSMLTLDHEVTCWLEDCVITPCVEGSNILTNLGITTSKNNTLNILCVRNDCPGLWEAFHGLNIKSLSLGDKDGYFRFDVNHVQLLCFFLSSLTHLETLYIEMDYDVVSQWNGYHGLNTKSLSLSGVCEGLTVNRVESLTQFLAQLTKLDTLKITVFEDNTSLWEVLFGRNIKSLSLRLIDTYGDSGLNHKELFLQFLSSLAKLETLSIEVKDVIPGLLEALSSLNIKGLSMIDRSGYSKKFLSNSSSMFLGLSLLTNLETLSISVYEDSPDLWEALRGLKIRSLSLSHKGDGLEVNQKDSFSQCLSSLTQLKTLTIYVFTSINLQLPQSLECFNIYCHKLHPSKLDDLMNSMASCTHKVEIRLEFIWSNYKKYTSLTDYNDIKQKLKKLKNVIVKRFRIYDNAPGSDKWSHMRDIGVVNDDAYYYDSVDNREYNYFLQNSSHDAICSMQLQILPASSSTS